MHETLQPERAARERPRPRRNRVGKAHRPPQAEGVVEVGGARYRLDVERREFRNVADPTDRVSFACGDPLIEDGDGYRFTGEENRWLTVAALRLMDDPSLTLAEAFHNCGQDGHRFVPDWDRDLEFNRHYLLFPKRCKVCGLRIYRTEAASRPRCPPHALGRDPSREATRMKDYQVVPLRCARCGRWFQRSVKVHAYGDVK